METLGSLSEPFVLSVVTHFVGTPSISQESLAVHHLSPVKQSPATREDPLFAKIAIKEGKKDEGKPDHQDEPEFLVCGHLVPYSAGFHGCGTKLGALQDPLCQVADDDGVLHPEDQVRAVDDLSHPNPDLSHRVSQTPWTPHCERMGVFCV